MHSSLAPPVHRLSDTSPRLLPKSSVASSELTRSLSISAPFLAAQPTSGSTTPLRWLNSTAALCPPPAVISSVCARPLTLHCPSYAAHPAAGAPALASTPTNGALPLNGPSGGPAPSGLSSISEMAHTIGPQSSPPWSEFVMHAIACTTTSPPASALPGTGNDAACQQLRHGQQPFLQSRRARWARVHVPVSLVAARVRDAHQPLVPGEPILAVQELDLEPAVVGVALVRQLRPPLEYLLRNARLDPRPPVQPHRRRRAQRCVRHPHEALYKIERCRPHAGCALLRVHVEALPVPKGMAAVLMGRRVVVLGLPKGRRVTVQGSGHSKRAEDLFFHQQCVRGQALVASNLLQHGLQDRRAPTRVLALHPGYAVHVHRRAVGAAQAPLENLGRRLDVVALG